MREPVRDPIRIQHILESSSNILKFMENKTVDDLQNDKLLFYGVVKNIEIIGEAAYKLTNEFKEKHSHIPWKQIIVMRHILVHDYYRIKPDELFEVYKKDIPELIDNISKITL